jgi:hypothetical protein
MQNGGPREFAQQNNKMEQRNHFAQQMNKICSATAEQIAQQLLSKLIIWNKIC